MLLACVNHHSSQECALAPLRTAWHVNTPKGEFSLDTSADENAQGTKVCYSWNDGRCAVPYCHYQHICAKCSFPSHKALHCNAYQGMRSAEKIQGVDVRYKGWFSLLQDTMYHLSLVVHLIIVITFPSTAPVWCTIVISYQPPTDHHHS